MDFKGNLAVTFVQIPGIKSGRAKTFESPFSDGGCYQSYLSVDARPRRSSLGPHATSCALSAY